MTLSTFAGGKAVERLWAPHLDRWIGETYRLRPSTDAEEWQGIDRHVVDEHGCDVTLEYKFDQRWPQTGNVFIETVSNAGTERPGWALTCQAVWLLYFLVPHRVLVFQMSQLRQAVDFWRERYPERAAHNEGYDTLGLCVPIPVAEQAAEYVAHLDRGDGFVLQSRDHR